MSKPLLIQDLEKRLLKAGDTMTGLLTLSGNPTANLGAATKQYVDAVQNGNVASSTTASKLATARTISLTGDVSGSGSFDGSRDLNITTTIANDSHTHSLMPAYFLDSISGPYIYTDSDNNFMVRAGSSSAYKYLNFSNDGKLYIGGIALANVNDLKNYLPLSGGELTGSLKVGTQIKMWSDAEGANIRLYTPSSSTNCFEFDTYDGSLRLYYSTDGGNGATGFQSWRWATDGSFTASKVYGAVWNDYAEFRTYKDSAEIPYGKVVIENGDDSLSLSTERLQKGGNIVSDTFGFAIGETDDCKLPIAVSGRVLAYTNEDRYSYGPGDAVCTGPNGTISKMTEEEIRNYPDRIIGYVSAIPEYETWGTGNVEVNDRIWIKVI